MRTSLLLVFIAGSSSLGAQSTGASRPAPPTRVAVKAAHLIDPRGTGRRIDDVALRNAIQRGDVDGPRMQVATMPLSATGGHGDLNGFSPYLSSQTLGGPR